MNTKIIVAAWIVVLVAQPIDVEATKSKSLFNGKDLTGWKVDVPALDKEPDGKKPFIVRDDKLVSLGKPRGHLITDGKYENFRLQVEYRFAAKPGNCGVLVHASTPRSLYKMFPQVDRSADESSTRWRLLVHCRRHHRTGHGETPRSGESRRAKRGVFST